MSTENTPNQQPAIDPYLASTQVLNQQVFLPVFVNKLAADYGIETRNEGELESYLRLNEYLKGVEANGQTKQAGDRAGFLQGALEVAAQLAGAQAPSAVSDAQVKMAAAEWASDPYLRDAALIFGDQMRRAAQ